MSFVPFVWMMSCLLLLVLFISWILSLLWRWLLVVVNRCCGGCWLLLMPWNHRWGLITHACHTSSTSITPLPINQTRLLVWSTSDTPLRNSHTRLLRDSWPMNSPQSGPTNILALLVIFTFGLWWESSFLVSSNPIRQFQHPFQICAKPCFRV